MYCDLRVLLTKPQINIRHLKTQNPTMNTCRDSDQVFCQTTFYNVVSYLGNVNTTKGPNIDARKPSSSSATSFLQLNNTSIQDVLKVVKIILELKKVFSLFFSYINKYY